MILKCLVPLLFGMAALGVNKPQAVAQPNPSCSMDPIILLLTTPSINTDLPVRAVEMYFEDATRVMSDGSIQPFVRPTIKFRVGVNLAKAQGQFCALAKDKVEENGLTFDGCGLGGPAVAPTRLTLPGSVDVSKWASMTGFCCTWFKCHSCEWKTRLFSRSVGVRTYFDRIVSHEPLPAASNSPSNAKATGKTDLTFSTSGETIDDRSFLEKIWDFVTGFLEWIGRVFGKDWKLQFSDLLGEQLGQLQSQSLDPMNFLTLNEKSFGFSYPFLQRLKVREYKQRGVWDVFLSSLVFQDRQTIFEAQAETSQAISFAIDYDAFLKGLNDLFNSSTNPIIVTDPLYKDNFCAVGRDEARKFLERLRSKLQGDPESGFNSIVKRGTARKVIEDFYGVAGADEYLRSAKKLLPRKKLTSIVAPPLSTILSNPAVVPATGTLYGMANESTWSKEEYSCAKRTALKRHGSIKRVRPFETFEECLSGDPVSKLQRWALLKALKSVSLAADAAALSAPISGRVAYRGWYSCSNFPQVCGLGDMMAWWQEPSKYGARLGRHYAIEMVDASNGSGTTRVQAIADGTVFPVHGDPAWGNALLQPFRWGGRTFIAVYGHLTSEARLKTSKVVVKGEDLSAAGCNEHGNGECNESCVAGGTPRTERHLYFELIEAVSSVAGVDLKKIDPATVVPLSISDEGQRFLYVCERPNSASAKVTLRHADASRIVIKRDGTRLQSIDEFQLDLIDPRDQNEIQKLLLRRNYWPRNRKVGDFWARTSLLSPVSGKLVSETARCTWKPSKRIANCVINRGGGRFEIAARHRSFDLKSSEFQLVMRRVGKRGFRIANDEPRIDEAAGSHPITVNLRGGFPVHKSLQF
jgi:hypothetical protein